jgi:hypothetical protein
VSYRAVIRFLRAKTRVLRNSILNYERQFTAKVSCMKELEDNGVECSKVGEQTFAMKCEVFGHL